MSRSASQLADSVLCKIAEEEERPEKSTLQKLLPLLVGGGLTAGSYALLRQRRLSNNPVLRAIQERTGKDFYHTPYDMMTEESYKKLPWYRKLMRRVLYGPEAPTHWDPKAGRYRVSKELEARIRRGEAGAANYMTDKPLMGNRPDAPYTPEGFSAPWGRAGSLRAANRGRGVYGGLMDKKFEMDLLNQYAPEAGMKTLSIPEVMKKYNIVDDPKRPQKTLAALQKALRQEFQDTGFMLKVRSGGAASSGRFPTEKTDLVKAYRDWAKMRQKMAPEAQRLQDELAKGTGGNPNAVVEKYRRRRGFEGHVFEDWTKGHFDPASATAGQTHLDNLIAQEKVKLLKHDPRIAKRMKAMGGGPTKEYRVHLVGGEPVKGMSVSRYYTGNPLDMATSLGEADDAAQWLKGQVSKLPKEYQGIPMAADVAPLEGGGYRVIELNPSFRSGVMPKIPFAGHKMYRHMTGRDTVEAALAKGLGIGALGAGGTAAGTSLYNRLQQPEQQA